MLELILWCALCSPKKPVHPFFDRTAKIELALSLTTASFDVAQSCHNLATGGHEYWLPGRCPGITAIDYAFVGVEELAAYAFHRHGHHKLERLVRLVSVEEQARGIEFSHAHGAW